MTQSKRLEMLEKMTASPSADAFAWYGLAMERRNSGDEAGAFAAFEQLRSRFPDYLPQYLMAGQLLIGLARNTEAADWLRRGIELARAAGNQKALGELESALSDCN
jgi:predicted Zn-dependent protease